MRTETKTSTDSLVEVREYPRMQSKKKKERIKEFLSTRGGN